jgi:hypothetical protein
MIILDLDHFYAYTMPWLKQTNSTYNAAQYCVGDDWYNAIDDQVLAEILGLTEA